MEGQTPKPSFKRPAWRGALSILVALIAIGLVIGPERILAAFQHLLGSVPEAGNVSSVQGKALDYPVEYSQGGIVLRVENLITLPDHTYLVYTLSGETGESLSHIAYLQTVGGYTYYSQGYHVVPAGPAITNTTYRITAIFEALPNISDVRLVWEHNPSPQPVNNDIWVIPIHLLPLTDEQRLRLYPPAYAPSQASDTQDGINLQVIQVAAMEKSTAIKLQIQSLETFSRLTIQNSALSDDSGRVYRQQPAAEASAQGQPVLQSTAPGTPPTWSINQTLTYSPTAPVAKELALSVDQLMFRAVIERTLQVPLKIGVKARDSWPVDLSLPVTDWAVHFSQAKLVEGTDQGSKFPVLVLIPDPLHEPENVKITLIQSNPDARASIEASIQGPLIAVKLREVDLRSNSVAIAVDYIEGSLLGPWKITWQTP